MIMDNKKKHLAYAGILGIIALLLTISFILPVMGRIASTSSWTWAKKNPKPNWWRWDTSYYPTEPVRGGYLHAASVRDIGLLNPNHWPVNDWATLSNMYDRLIYTDGKHRPTVPWLAKSWKYVNSVTMIMKLREGVTFTDGSVFDAAALKYQIDWIKDKKNGAWSRIWIEPVKSIEVVDTYTVRWRFKHPWSSFEDMFANVPGWCISAKALRGDVASRESKNIEKRIATAKKKLARLYEKSARAVTEGDEKAKKKYSGKIEKARKKVEMLEKQFDKSKKEIEGAGNVDQRGAGSGPFMLEEARPGNYIKLKRNPNWWFGKSIGKPDMPYFDGMKVTVIPEPSVRLANLKAGKIDTLEIEKSQYPEVKDDPNFSVWITPLNFTIFMAFNQSSGPCKDIRVRRAVSHAIDRKAVIASNELGFGRPASCYFPEDHYAHNPNLKPVEYNPELSKKLLAQAGYKDGLTLKGVLYNDSGSVRFGQIIKAMLAKVNINWDLEYLEQVATAEKYRDLKYDLGTFVGIYIKNPEQEISTYYLPDLTDENPERNNNRRAISLLEEARSELNFSKRMKLYHEIEKSLYDNYEDAWLYYYTSINATRKQLLGYNRKMQIEGGEAYWPTHPTWFKNGRRH